MFDSKKYYHDRYFKYKSEHRCVACGDPLEESNKLTRCAACRDKYRAALLKSYYKKKRRGCLSVLKSNALTEKKGEGLC